MNFEALLSMHLYISDKVKLREFKNDKLLLSTVPDDQVWNLVGNELQ